mmetsp:Transcript_37644/g.98824  ORF Transcript_37644/g.98824 Transcript_37644/m.98824 type:complete len:261 (+) Transcript_37644:1174-1956(+)
MGVGERVEGDEGRLHPRVNHQRVDGLRARGVLRLGMHRDDGVEGRSGEALTQRDEPPQPRLGTLAIARLHECVHHDRVRRGRRLDSRATHRLEASRGGGGVADPRVGGADGVEGDRVRHDASREHALEPRLRGSGVAGARVRREDGRVGDLVGRQPARHQLGERGLRVVGPPRLGARRHERVVRDAVGRGVRALIERVRLELRKRALRACGVGSVGVREEDRVEGDRVGRDGRGEHALQQPRRFGGLGGARPAVDDAGVR